jgi:hypothetical protein
LPLTARDISRRIEQIQFNATLDSELETLKLGKMIGRPTSCGGFASAAFRSTRKSRGLADESAGNLDWNFLERLHASGRFAAGLWLKQDMPGAVRSS